MEEKKRSTGIRSHCYWIFLSGNTTVSEGKQWKLSLETAEQVAKPDTAENSPDLAGRPNSPILPLWHPRSHNCSVISINPSAPLSDFNFYRLNSQKNTLPSIQTSFSSSIASLSSPDMLSTQQAFFGKSQMSGITSPRLWSTAGTSDGCLSLQQEEMFAWYSYGFSHFQMS